MKSELTDALKFYQKAVNFSNKSAVEHYNIGIEYYDNREGFN